MPVPLRQQARVGAYVVKQRLARRARYPLVLMLEPLFRCNLACPGCGKIDYPDPILNRRLSADECVAAARECGAPIVSIAGGEPLLHREMGEIVRRMIDDKRFIYLCTNALLLEKKIDLFRPSPYLTFSIHLDGLEEEHDRAVDLDGVFERAVAAVRMVRDKGFRVNVNTTLFDGVVPAKVAEFLDFATELGVEGVTISPGYSYERAPDQAHFLKRRGAKELFREVFRLGEGKKWRFSQSSLFLDFLAGNQSYKCTPWGNPTRNVFGWQRPCYLLNEGYVATFAELMDETEWDKYGTGNYEKCADCMVHCGYEATAVNDTVRHPLKAARVALFGPRTEGPMAPEIALEGQRPAEYPFEAVVAEALGQPAQGEKPRAGSSNAA